MNALPSWVLILAAGVYLFPSWMGFAWFLLKLRKATQHRGFWHWSAKLEPRDLWVGFFWDSKPGGLHCYFVLCPGTVIHGARYALTIVPRGETGREPGEAAPPLPERPDGAVARPDELVIPYGDE